MQAGKSGHRELDEMGREYLQKQRGEKELRRVMERLVSQSEGEKEGEQDKLGEKLVAQRGFLLEFNLSGWGRKGRREGRQGPAWVNSSMEYV